MKINYASLYLMKTYAVIKMERNKFQFITTNFARQQLDALEMKYFLLNCHMQDGKNLRTDGSNSVD